MCITMPAMSEWVGGFKKHFFNHLALYLCHLVRKILQEYPCKTCTFLQGKDHLSCILQDLVKCKTMVLSLQKCTQVLQGYSCKIFLTGQLSHMQNYEHTYYALEHFDVCNAWWSKSYRKQGKIRWIKLLWFLNLPWKFSCEFLAIGK